MGNLGVPMRLEFVDRYVTPVRVSRRLLARFVALTVAALVAAACTSEAVGVAETSVGGGDDLAAPTNELQPEEQVDESETAVASASAEGSEDSEAEPDELVLAHSEAPRHANALLAGSSAEILASSLVLEPLAEFRPDGTLSPVLAAEIPTLANGGISADRQTVLWRLRTDVLWSDGSSFTAADVEFTYGYCALLSTGCTTDSFDSVSGVEALSDQVVRIRFDEPQTFPFRAFVSSTSPILQEDQFERCIGSNARRCVEENEQPIGTGPFVVTDLRSGDGISFTANDRYRGAGFGLPRFRAARIESLPSAELAARAVLSNRSADFATTLMADRELIDELERADGGRLAVAYGADVEHINLNQTDPSAQTPSEDFPHPLFVDNSELQRALSLAIDREELTEVGYGLAGRATCTMWPVGNLSRLGNGQCPTQDNAAANEILDNLGYLDTDGDGVREAPGFGPLRFSFATSTNSTRQQVQEIVARDWARIGVSVDQRVVDSEEFFDRTCETLNCLWRFPAAIQMFTNGTDTPDAAGYLDTWTSTNIPSSANGWSGDNVPRFNDADFDALVDELQNSPNPSTASNIAIRDASELLSSTAVIPLVNRGEIVAISNSIDGVGVINGWDSHYWNIELWRRVQ